MDADEAVDHLDNYCAVTAGSFTKLTKTIRQIQAGEDEPEGLPSIKQHDMITGRDITVDGEREVVSMLPSAELSVNQPRARQRKRPVPCPS